MNRTIVAKALAGAFYLIGALFVIFIGFIALRGNTMFNLNGLIISSLGVCIPVGIATILLISVTDQVDKRYKIVRVFVLSVLPRR